LNKDGKISKEELKIWLSKQYQENSENGGGSDDDEDDGDDEARALKYA
jgi:hypothetical protein